MVMVMHVFLPKYEYSTVKTNLELCSKQSLNVESVVV